jgi:uncharacterized protein (TIGR02453 family)
MRAERVEMESSEPQFHGFTKDTIRFFEELAGNNTTTWFASNKERYTHQVMKELRELAWDLQPVLMAIDPRLETRPEKAISRIYRDLRFSHDKSPYKTTMWITYKRLNKTWQDYPSFFFELSGSSYRYGMGFYSATRATMDLFRESIDKNPGIFRCTFNTIPGEGSFVIEGDMYKKRIPNDLPEELQVWYQRKNIYLVCNRKIDDDLFSRHIFFTLQEGFERLAPFYYFMWRLKEGSY